ncbi:hypothetical protein AL072_32995 [Azospirillum thiophilum]|uniref:Uncharacterized protein n=1 Tax=Azospirillum thiophilum TaxID=528244 RepID=A0AAC8W605_9PROT|nr:hypothetical protein [Azospirillum thiophilum]ALG75751.1 hypothetical protein AL072_32995 [Azospirillum thiophilum]
MLDIIAEAIATFDATSRAEILCDAIDTKTEALIAAKIRDRINAILGGRRAIREVTFSRLQCGRGPGDGREQNIDLVVCDGEATIAGGTCQDEGLHLIELKQYYDFDCARALKHPPYRGLQEEITYTLARLAAHQHRRIRSRYVIMAIVRLGPADTGATWKYTPRAKRQSLLKAMGEIDPVTAYLVDQRRSPGDATEAFPPPSATGEIDLGQIDGFEARLFWAAYAS